MRRQYTDCKTSYLTTCIGKFAIHEYLSVRMFGIEIGCGQAVMLLYIKFLMDM